jgi:hypothetical protein
MTTLRTTTPATALALANRQRLEALRRLVDAGAWPS